MSDKTLHGAQIPFRGACNTGLHTDSFGVGDMHLSLHRPHAKYQWLDLGRINFSNPTPDQLLDAATAPAYSPGAKAYSDICRRPSFKQAQVISAMIIIMLNKSFNGTIPADDEIDEFLIDWKSKQ